MVYCVGPTLDHNFTDLESDLSDYLCEHLVDPSTGRKVLSNSIEGVAACFPDIPIEM